MQPTNMTYQIYKNSEDFQLWPIDEVKFVEILHGLSKYDKDVTTEVFMSKDSKFTLQGFLTAKVKDDKGVITFIFVSKEFRKQGMGRKLMNQALEFFKAEGVKKIYVGAKIGSYFWPGIPKNLNCEKFFEKFGFEVKDEGLVDMYQDISNYIPPTGAYDALTKENVNIAYATEESGQKILEFAKVNFPNWYDYYKNHIDNGEFENVFYASINDEVVGVSVLWQNDCNWKILFENNVGGGGALGVAEKWQGKSIGLAMKSWGTERIKEKGIKYVWISWTYAIDFYKKLGFEVWREYFMGKKTI